MMPVSSGTQLELVDSKFVFRHIVGVLDPPATLREPDKFFSFRDAVAGRFDALAIAVEREPAGLRRAPVFPLTASDAGGHARDERLHLVLQCVKFPGIHGRKHDAMANLSPDK